MEWIDLAPNRDQWRAFVNTVMNLLVPYNAGKFLSSCTSGSFSRRAQLHEVTWLWHLIFWSFIKTCRHIQVSVAIGKQRLSATSLYRNSLIVSRSHFGRESAHGNVGTETVACVWVFLENATALSRSRNRKGTRKFITVFTKAPH
jgi:hypothetical protein